MSNLGSARFPSECNGIFHAVIRFISSVCKSILWLQSTPGVTGIQHTIKRIDWHYSTWFKKLDFYNYIGKIRRIGGLQTIINRRDVQVKNLHICIYL